MKTLKYALLVAMSLVALSRMSCGQTQSNEAFDSLIWFQLWTNSPVIVKCQLKDDPREPWGLYGMNPHKFMTASIEKVFRGPNTKGQTINVDIVEFPYSDFPDGKSWILFLRRTTADRYYLTSYDFGVQPAGRFLEFRLEELKRIDSQSPLRN